MANTYLAVDFGGGSGRVMAGTIIEGKLQLEEIYRFGNRQIKLGSHLYWDFPALYEDMKTGLKVAAQKGYSVNGIGIDTWGVDFGLIDKEGNLVCNPICYRDSRTEGIPEKVFKVIDEKEHYAVSGIQVMSINSLFQLYSMKIKNDVRLNVADKLLFMPDLFSYYLTGEVANEYSIASTSELLDAKTRSWNKELIDSLGIPGHLFGKIIQPGTIRGKLTLELAKETGLGEVCVIAVGSHDTASAVVAVPSIECDKAFLSSGTWSLLGTEVAEPILTETARNNKFTNEGGVGGNIRFLQNITGLWILQRLMAEWELRGERISYDDILKQASKTSFTNIINVDNHLFLNPESMENAICKYFENASMKSPSNKAEFVLCVLKSLACKYKKAINSMNECLERPIKQLHIIGGGSQIDLLNQLTSNYLGIPVYAGPVEATAIGNIMVQALAKGEIKSMKELKDIVVESISPKVYYPN